CMQNVTVTDKQSPNITACAAPVNVDADVNACSAVVTNLGTPTVSDNCTLTPLSVNNNHPSNTFPIGTTVVTWTVTDAAGNSSICTQNVTAIDKQKPNITACAAPVNVDADVNACSAVVTNLGTPTVSDN